MKLENRVAVVTGGGRGLGQAIALAFAEQGASLVIGEIDLPAGEKVVEKIGSLGRRSLAVKADVTNKKEVEEMVRVARQEFGRIDIVVNSAGVTMVCPSEKLEETSWDKALDTDLKGVFLCCQAAAREMIKQKSGNIINIASGAGVVALPERAAYCSAKAGVIMLTKVLACEWAGRGIRVNALAPGYCRTEMTMDLVRRGLYDEKVVARRTPMGRLGSPEEIGKAAVFLASDESSFVTGHTLVVDGGWSAYGYLESWLDQPRE